jgi:predicted PurR-regulated permease PerM
MLILLIVLSALAVLALVGVLVVYLWRISSLLNSIGGSPTSFLAKLRLGLRAIETETGHLEAQVTQLNASLSSVAEGLQAVDGHLVTTIEAVQRQAVPRSGEGR